jgi:hypothetical protein
MFTADIDVVDGFSIHYVVTKDITDFAKTWLAAMTAMQEEVIDG